jgi:hypothetical protein
MIITYFVEEKSKKSQTKKVASYFETFVKRGQGEVKTKNPFPPKKGNLRTPKSLY